MRPHGPQLVAVTANTPRFRPPLTSACCSAGRWHSVGHSATAPPEMTHTASAGAAESRGLQRDFGNPPRHPISVPRATATASPRLEPSGGGALPSPHLQEDWRPKGPYEVQSTGIYFISIPDPIIWKRAIHFLDQYLTVTTVPG